MPDINQLRDQIERETPKLLASIGTAARGGKDMGEWLEGKNRFDNSAPDWRAYIYGELIRRYALSVITLDASRPDLYIMLHGYAPIGPDGEPINLYHATQDEPGPVAEVTKSQHQHNFRELHMSID